ncbi:Cytochrome P450 [Penicillium cf. griseofulvum]|uniref:Cytochrome P450 n=1 Tax=Penicillium cf. griseofulvum TaxID=2972120 RepID=A0A9W9ME34_9EURO|nr:Cytochrome P450 [Penicillium cf. griseofulvum]KAJ5424237.1 Cytochrome P450 [Penicillium cf. griseofulvum]KAJ5442525.1 Cytochrome P450 [Penicillium cf. griseofulvum]
MIALPVAAAWFAVFLVFQVILIERRLAAIPGPFIAKFTDYWKVYHLLKGDYGETLYWWHQRYGPMIRTGPRHISVGDPNEVPRVYQIKPLLHKGNMYKGIIGWLKGKNVAGLESMMDEVEHANVKRVIAPAFSWRSVLNYESHIDHSAGELVQTLENREVVDMNEWLSYWAIDSMNNIAFSTDLGFMKHATDIGGTLKTVRAVTSIWMYVFAFPTVVMWFAWAASFFVGPSGRLVSMCLERVNSRMRKKKEQDKSTKNEEDLLDVYMRARQEHPTLISHERVIGMTFTTLLAGSDTTAFNLAWTVYYLLKHPATLHHLKEELDNAILASDLSYPPTLKDLSKLPYLEAVIKEGLRYALLLQLNMDRIVPKGGMEICGHHIPAGTNIGCHARVIHLDKSVYGEDSEHFRPERWLEASEEQRKLMERCAIWFGSGKHTCIGQHFARAMTMKVLSMILMKLEVGLEVLQLPIFLNTDSVGHPDL